MGRRRKKRSGGGRERTFDAFAPRPKALEAKGGIRAESRQGDFGSSWWAKRWQSILDGLHLGGRLARGRTYARQGQVLSIVVERGKVFAQVQGSRPKPYDVKIGVRTLAEQQWGRVVESLSKKALFVAKLLAGEMPQNIEDVFTGAKLALFPEKRGDLKTECSCPDDANPCKHIAAVYYLLGEEFDRDPFLIFRLRGLEREELLARLSRSAPAAEEAPAVLAEPLSTDIVAFWSPPVEAEEYGDVQAPPVTAGVVRRLGKFPFWRGDRPLYEAVEPVYIQASALGLNAFLGERDKK